ncbi:hypothetical protein H0H93_004406 [Arthromyces matolae]|nr:hypothetical protein H0H93_004406 [Arthromyces matolae]
MDHLYDKERASEALERLVEESKKSDDSPLHSLLNDPEWHDRFVVAEMNKPKAWRLVRADEDGNATDEEIVFTVYGALAEFDLPPFAKAFRGSPDIGKFKYLKQYVKIDGLGIKSSLDSISAAIEIRGLYDRSFQANKLDAWTSGTKETSEGFTFDIANRLFTPVNDTADNDPHVPFQKEVDPHGVLELMVAEGLKHTEDNNVRYAKGKLMLDGNMKFTKMGPQAFRRGDLVAADLSFVVVPIKGERFRMINVLRSLTLLDGSFKMDSVRVEAFSVQPPLKRKRRFVDEVKDVETGLEKEDNVDGEDGMEVEK